MAELQLKVETLRVKEIIDDFRAGRLVIPEFQRAYVWKKNRAPKLLDSLYRKYPVSTLLVWHSDEEVRSRSPAKSVIPQNQRVGWLIDGQQRVTTLLRIIDGSEDIDVVFHPKEEEFQLASAATRNDPDWIHVSEIFDKSSYKRLQRDLPDTKAGERKAEAIDRVRDILNYEIPVVKMHNHSFLDAKEAFTRINQSGVKLKVEELRTADIAAQHQGFIADEVVPFIKDLHDNGFNRVNLIHLFRACGFIIAPDGRNRTSLHEFSTKEVLAAWRKTKLATNKTIDFVHNHFGLQDMNILWSGFLLVPAIVLHAKWSANERDPEALAGWMALASLFHRYSSATETALDQDLKACRKQEAIGSLLSNLRNIRPTGLLAVEGDFNRSLQDRGVLFASYLACRHLGMHDLFTTEKLAIAKDIDRHHILPRSQFKPDERKFSDTIANIAFIFGETNKSIGNDMPSIYLSKLKEESLVSQCIPTNNELWNIENSRIFWRERRILLAKAFNSYVKSKLPTRQL